MSPEELAELSDDRVRGIALMRQWMRDQFTAGRRSINIEQDMREAVRSLAEEFRVEFIVEGVRYWHHPESGSYFTTGPGEDLGQSPDAELCIQLTRDEYLSRQGIWRRYQEDRL